MSLKVEINPAQASAGSTVEFKVIQQDVEEYSNYVRIFAVGQPYATTIKNSEEDGVFTGKEMIPYEAYPGHYQLKISTVGGTEESTNITFRVT